MFGGNKNDLVIENAKLSVENESLKKQVDQLLKMVDRLQEALVAREAPQAFASQVAERLNAAQAKNVDPKQATQQKIISDYLELMESGRAFDVSDMDGLLGHFTTDAVAPSLHNDSES